MPCLEKLKTAVVHLQKNWGDAPPLGIVLGSGLGPFAETLENAKSFSTQDIPGSVGSSVVGHQGKLVFGKHQGKALVALSGRIHAYEGHSPNQVVFNLRALKMWGVKKFILTNAAGSTNKDVSPGSLVFIKDQINFTGSNPLIGTELYEGERFADMSNLYDKDWREEAFGLAQGLGLNVNLAQGVYLGVTGPAYETAAEIQMYFKMGADLCGMSTVWEALAVHQMGAKVLGISCVTNLCTGISDQPLSHQEVLDTSKRVRDDFIKLVGAIIRES